MFKAKCPECNKSTQVPWMVNPKLHCSNCNAELEYSKLNQRIGFYVCAAFILVATLLVFTHLQYTIPVKIGILFVISISFSTILSLATIKLQKIN